MSKLNNNETIVYYFDQTQGPVYITVYSEVCALTFLCYLTSLVIFLRKI